MPYDDHTGARIAAQRKLAGYTQRGFADRIPYSYSLLTQVESGHKSPSPDFIAACARALSVDVTALTGQPYVTELQQDRLDGLIRPIRESLDLYDVGPDSDPTGVRTAAELVGATEDLCRLVRATQLNKAAATLPQVIAELTAAAHRAPSTELWAALGSAYRTAHDIAVKLGFYDLSTIALDRMGWAAERASDPLLAAARQYMRALAYHREGEPAIGLRLVSSGQALVAQAPESRPALVVAGQLHLGASVIAARAQDVDAVRTHLAEAGRCADQTGDASRVYWLSFGPANVAAHEVAASLETHQYGAALEKARGTRLPDDWAVSRRAHFLADRARSEAETGRTEAALRSLCEARQLAPQQTRYHPGTRETIKGLVRAARRTPDTLSHMAAWVGL